MRPTIVACAARFATVVALIVAGAGGAAGAEPPYAATFGAVALPRLVAGSTISVEVTIANTGTATWTSDAAAGAVALSYHWYANDGSLVTWDGARTGIGAVIGPGETARVAAKVRAPASPSMFVLAMDLVREGIAWFGSSLRLDARIEAPADAATYAVGAGASATSSRPSATSSGRNTEPTRGT